MRAARLLAACAAWSVVMPAYPGAGARSGGAVDALVPREVGRCHESATERRAKHRVAMATIVNNEGRWLPEWIMFHRLLGVDHFYIYDDKSTDDTRDVVRAFAELGWATLYDDVVALQREFAIDVPAHVRFTPQFVIVQHVARAHAQDTEWLALFDVDEFLLPRTSAWLCIGDALIRSHAKCGVLRLRGTLFLPNTTETRPLPPSRLLIDTASFFVPVASLHDKDRVPLHKNFARPEAIARIDHGGIHNMRPSGGYTLHIAKPTALFFAHFRYRTLSDFAAKKRKAYAGHADKSAVWERLTLALLDYKRAGVALPATHPLRRYKRPMRQFYASFRAWYAQPSPRPQLDVPLAFGQVRPTAAPTGVASALRGRATAAPAAECGSNHSSAFC